MNRQTGEEAQVFIVSGLPRSGTSLMMKMIEAGGIPVLADQVRAADEDNPKGYYEFERVKRLPEGDHAWLASARGKAVKVIFALLPSLPPGYSYKAIFMRRNIGEILASQRTMLARRGKTDNIPADAEMAAVFDRHLRNIFGWVRKQSFIEYLEVDYNGLLADPAPVIRDLRAFLGEHLDYDKMAAAIDPALYRQRSGAANPPSR